MRVKVATRRKWKNQPATKLFERERENYKKKRIEQINKLIELDDNIQFVDIAVENGERNSKYWKKTQTMIVKTTTITK